MSAHAELFERLALHIPALQESMLNEPLIQRTILVALGRNANLKSWTMQYNWRYEEVDLNFDGLIEDLFGEGDGYLQAVAVCILQWCEVTAYGKISFQKLCLRARLKIMDLKCERDQITRLNWSVTVLIPFYDILSCADEI